MAGEEAVRLGHGAVRTEHILIAIVDDGESLAFAMLTNLGISRDELRERVVKAAGPGAAEKGGMDLPYDGRGKKVLELAMREAQELNHDVLGTEHLLLGLVREKKGIAAQVLRDLGAREEAVRAEALRLLDNAKPELP